MFYKLFAFNERRWRNLLIYGNSDACGQLVVSALGILRQCNSRSVQRHCFCYLFPIPSLRQMTHVYTVQKAKKQRNVPLLKILAVFADFLFMHGIQHIYARFTQVSLHVESHIRVFFWINWSSITIENLKELQCLSFSVRPNRVVECIADLWYYIEKIVITYYLFMSLTLKDILTLRSLHVFKLHLN